MIMKIERINYLSGDFREFCSFCDKYVGYKLKDEFWDWEYSFNYAKTVIIVVKIQNKIVGCFSNSVIPLNIFGEIYITGRNDNVYLDKEYRNTGIYHEMHTATFNEAKKEELAFFWGFTKSYKFWVRKYKWGYIENPILQSNFRIRNGKFNEIQSGNQMYKAVIFCLRLGLSIRNRFLISMKRNNSNVEIVFDKFDFQGIKCLYESLSKRNNGFIHLEMDEAFINWRIINNPNINYKILSLYHQNQLMAYSIYSVQNDSIVISDIIYDGKLEFNMLLKAMLKRTKSTKPIRVRFYGNEEFYLNKKTFNSFANYRGKVEKCFIPQINYFPLCDKLKKFDIGDASKWYFNELWTEGYHT